MKGRDEEGVAEKNASLIDYVNQVASDLKERIEHQRLTLTKFLEDPSNTIVLRGTSWFGHRAKK